MLRVCSDDRPDLLSAPREGGAPNTAQTVSHGQSVRGEHRARGTHLVPPGIDGGPFPGIIGGFAPDLRATTAFTLVFGMTGAPPAFLGIGGPFGFGLPGIVGGGISARTAIGSAASKAARRRARRVGMLRMLHKSRTSIRSRSIGEFWDLSTPRCTRTMTRTREGLLRSLFKRGF